MKRLIFAIAALLLSIGCNATTVGKPTVVAKQPISAEMQKPATTPTPTLKDNADEAIANAEAPFFDHEPPSVEGVFIIGFPAGTNPCRDDVYEQTLQILSQGFATPSIFQARSLIGQCMKVLWSRYWIMIYVDDVPMIARFDQNGLPVRYCTSKDHTGQIPGPKLPLTPPGNVSRGQNGGFQYTHAGTTNFLMPPGTHKITFELYMPNATGACYSRVDARERTYTFPYDMDPYGRHQKAPETYIHNTKPYNPNVS